MTKAPIIHGHASSRYDKPPKKLAEQVARAVGHEDPEANLLSWTEVGDPDRAEKLTADGWGTYAPHDKTDVAFMWNKAIFELAFKDVQELTDKTWTDGQGHVHKTKCASVILNCKLKDRRLLATVCHLPSGVQDGNNFNDEHPKKVAAWKAALPGWHNYLNDTLRPVYRPDFVMVIADWNVDFHSAHWRGYVQDVFPGKTLTWAGDMPNGGTHGDRLIDATWADHNGKCVLLEKREGTSDHRPYAEKLTWNDD